MEHFLKNSAIFLILISVIVELHSCFKLLKFRGRIKNRCNGVDITFYLVYSPIVFPEFLVGFL
jgi:hypothetical protein